MQWWQPSTNKIGSSITKPPEIGLRNMLIRIRRRTKFKNYWKWDFLNKR